MTMTLDRSVAEATAQTITGDSQIHVPPFSSTGGRCAIALSSEDRKQTTAKRDEWKRLSPSEAHEAFDKWLPVGKSLFWRSGLPRCVLGDLLQEVFLRFFFRHVHKKHPVKNAGALLTTILLNLMRSHYRRNAPQTLNDVELVDPSSQKAKEMEEREDQKHIINRVLSAASREECRAAMAFLATGNHREAVDALLAQEEILAPSQSQWNRRHNSYRVAMTRLRRRGRQISQADGGV